MKEAMDPGSASTAEDVVNAAAGAGLSEAVSGGSGGTDNPSGWLTSYRRAPASREAALGKANSPQQERHSLDANPPMVASGSGSYSAVTVAACASRRWSMPASPRALAARATMRCWRGAVEVEKTVPRVPLIRGVRDRAASPHPVGDGSTRAATPRSRRAMSSSHGGRGCGGMRGGGSCWRGRAPAR